MYRGRDTLMADNNLENYFFSTGGRAALAKDIPVLNLLVGNYGDAEMEATLDINSRAITNAQIIIAGATGSGKTNLFAVLMQQIHPYPQRVAILSTSFCSTIRESSVTFRTITGCRCSM